MKRQRKILKKIHITRSVVPNLLTLGNIFSGFTAIVYMSQGDFFLGTFYIVMAAVFDMLDGIVARLLGATSEIGAELDSLCDAVSFGVAPSFMLYKAYFYQFDEIGILIASLPALAGVLRLARFNVQMTSFDDKLYFRGLPIPGGALTIISFVVFYLNDNYFGSYWTGICAFAVSIIVAAVMVSTFKFDNFPRPSLRNFKANPIMFIGVLAAFVVGFITWGWSVFPTMMLYIIYSAIKAFVNGIREIRRVKYDL
ncbi:MAG: CDP-diacylglycerol--serine O-phosphatidyltransferase [Ignavibacteria bacterium]|nr:CDP-diacylglycerol--serine O-phosphatidyltransferase [Ignavibacteria bacterium]